MNVIGPGTEESLRAGHLSEEELVPHAGSVTVPLPERTTDAGQQDLLV